MSSLRARLLGLLLGGVLLVGVVGGWVVYRNALAEADAFFDYHLRQTALLLRDQPVQYLLAPQFPPATASYDFVVQVWSLDGVRVYLSRPHTVLPEITTLGFSTVSTSEGRWRVFGIQAVTRVIQVAQPMSVREQRAAELALETLKPFALLLPLLALFIWFAVGHALEPLRRLTALVKARRVEALESLPDSQLPAEVQPLVGALNELLARLQSALGRERAFMADAAHELRTPLTALHLQMGMLARASDEGERAGCHGHAVGGGAARHPPGGADAGAGAPGAARRGAAPAACAWMTWRARSSPSSCRSPMPGASTSGSRRRSRPWSRPMPTRCAPCCAT